MANTKSKITKSIRRTGFLESKKIQDMHGSSSAIVEAMRATKGIQEMLGSSSAIVEAMRATKGIQEMLGSSSAIAEAMRATKGIQEMLGSSIAIAEAMRATKGMQEMIGRSTAIAEAARFTKSMRETFKPSHALGAALATMSRPQNISAAIRVIGQDLAGGSRPQSNPPDPKLIKSSLTSVAAAEDAATFAVMFERIPHFLQLILVFLFLQLILPQLNSISANLLTPYVEKIIASNSISGKDKVRVIRRLGLKQFDLPSEELRFISGSNVWLRSEPGTKSEALDSLRLGQLVVFIEKKRNWSNVMVQYENGEIVSGWVFTRYVTKFKK